MDNRVHLMGYGVSAQMGSYALVQSVGVPPGCVEAITLALCCHSYQLGHQPILAGVPMVGLQRQDR